MPSRLIPTRPVPGKKITRGWFPTFWDYVKQMAADLTRLEQRVKDVSAGALDPPYTGPFAADIYDSTTVVVGSTRADSEYPFRDQITVKDATGTHDIPKTISETVSATGSGYVYYQVESGPWTATLKFSTTWEPSGAGTNTDDIFIPVAYVTYFNAAIQSVEQLQHGNIWITEGGSGGGYAGPHLAQVDGTVDTTVNVGTNRSATQPDVITIHQKDGEIATVVKTAEDPVTSVTSNGYIYYRLHRGSGGTWTANLEFSATYPPGTEQKDDLYIPIAYAQATVSGVTALWQMQYGNFDVRERPMLASFEAEYENNQAVINGGKVFGVDQILTVAGTTINLSETSNRFVSVEIDINDVTGNPAGTYSWTFGTGFSYVHSTGDKIIWPIGEVSGGKWIPHHIGDIILDVFANSKLTIYGSSDEPEYFYQKLTDLGISSSYKPSVHQLVFPIIIDDGDGTKSVRWFTNKAAAPPSSSSSISSSSGSGSGSGSGSV